MTWTPAMLRRLRFLDGHATTTGGGLTALRALAQLFPDRRVALAALGVMERQRRPWLPLEEELVRHGYADTPTAELARRLRRPVGQVYQKAGRMGLKKSPAYMAGPHSCRLRRGDNVGAAYRFKPGIVPHNKGVKGWQAGGRAGETRFKRGELTGAAKKKWQPVGIVVTDRDGYQRVKVSDDRARPSRHNWKFRHVLLWEEHHGPVPAGHAVAFVDCNKARIVIENLELIERAGLMARNTIHRFPPELKQAIRLAGKLRRTIQGRTDEEQDPGPARPPLRHD